MSCNRCATTAEVIASTAGAGDIEAHWSGQRDHPQNCRECGAFLRIDGGCTQCDNALLSRAMQHPEPYEAGYAAGRFPEPVMTELAPAMSRSQNDRVRQAAAAYLADPERLSALGTNDGSMAVKAAAAGNRNTPAETVAGLLRSQQRAVYRAAASNPALPMSALEQAETAAKRDWEQLARQAIQPVIYQMAFSRGRKGMMGMMLLPSIMIGMYGAKGFRSWRRYRDLSLALKDRRRSAGVDQKSTPTISATSKPPTTRSSRLTPAEWRAVDEELKLAESGLEMAGDYYDDHFTIDDVVRIQNEGIAADHDADIAGYLLEQAEEAAEQFPNWHDGHGPDDFRAMQAKLRCTRCGLYAGASHRCHYSSRLTALRHPEAETESEGMSPVEVYAEVENV